MLAHVAVHLEERHIGQIGAGDLQYVGAVLGQDARDCRARDDAAHFEDFDAFKDPLASSLTSGEGSRRQISWNLVYLPGRLLDV